MPLQMREGDKDDDLKSEYDLHANSLYEPWRRVALPIPDGYFYWLKIIFLEEI